MVVFRENDFLLKFLFESSWSVLFVCMHVSARVQVCYLHVGSLRELESIRFLRTGLMVSCELLMWVLGTEPWSSARVVSTLKH